MGKAGKSLSAEGYCSFLRERDLVLCAAERTILADDHRTQYRCPSLRADSHGQPLRMLQREEI